MRQVALGGLIATKAEPPPYHYIIFQLVDADTTSQVSSNCEDGDVLIKDWMYERVFVLQREVSGLERKQKDQAILRADSSMGGCKMSACVEWDGVHHDSMPIAEKDGLYHVTLGEGKDLIFGYKHLGKTFHVTYSGR